jgi:hypothetical protein
LSSITQQAISPLFSTATSFLKRGSVPQCQQLKDSCPQIFADLRAGFVAKSANLFIFHLLNLLTMVFPPPPRHCETTGRHTQSRGIFRLDYFAIAVDYSTVSVFARFAVSGRPQRAGRLSPGARLVVYFPVFGVGDAGFAPEAGVYHILSFPCVFHMAF